MDHAAVAAAPQRDERRDYSKAAEGCGCSTDSLRARAIDCKTRLRRDRREHIQLIHREHPASQGASCGLSLGAALVLSRILIAPTPNFDLRVSPEPF